MTTLYDTQPLRDAVEAKLKAEKDLVAAVREAKTNGLSLRAIAAAAATSHETVRRLTA